MKPGTGKIERKVYSSHLLQSQKGFQNMILFAHAFSECDTTTSYLFGKGKRKCLKLLEHRDDLQDIVRIFNNANSAHDEVAQAGDRFFSAVYNAPASKKSTNQHRYEIFKKSAHKSKPNLALLPPTAAAAQRHSLRVYRTKSRNGSIMKNLPNSGVGKSTISFSLFEHCRLLLQILC